MPLQLHYYTCLRRSMPCRNSSEIDLAPHVLIFCRFGCVGMPLIYGETLGHVQASTASPLAANGEGPCKEPQGRGRCSVEMFLVQLTYWCWVLGTMLRLEGVPR